MQPLQAIHEPSFKDVKYIQQQLRKAQRFDSLIINGSKIFLICIIIPALLAVLFFAIETEWVVSGLMLLLTILISGAFYFIHKIGVNTPPKVYEYQKAPLNQITGIYDFRIKGFGKSSRIEYYIDDYQVGAFRKLRKTLTEGEEYTFALYKHPILLNSTQFYHKFATWIIVQINGISVEDWIKQHQVN